MKRTILRGMNVCLAVVVSMALLLASPCVSWAQGYEQEIANLSAKMAANIAKSGKNRIAVVDFTDLQGNVTELGRFIAEEFSVALLSTEKGFEIVDRTHLQSLLKEHKLSATGLIDPQTARQLGQIAGVDALVTGTITPFGESVRLSVKILDVSTAKLIGATAGEIPKTKAIEELLGRGITTGETGITSTETTAPKTSKTEGKAQQTAETQGFTFALQGCKRSGENATCHFLITSNDEDKPLRIYGAEDNDNMSRIFDDLGNEYFAGEVQLGSQRGTYTVATLLVAGIPTKASINFGSISPEAGIIALLELGCRKGDSGDWFTLQLRNVPFSK